MPDIETLGGRIKRLRTERGLSQADLAGGDLSPSYVSLIEAGHREPRPAALEAMASRLGVALPHLLTGAELRPARAVRMELDDAEMALRNGDPHLALDRYLALATEFGATGGAPENEGDREFWRAAVWGTARSHERLGDLRAATQRLEALRATGEPADTGPSWLQVLTDLSRCYRESGDRSLAARIAEEGLAAAHRLGAPVDSEALELANTLVGCYYESGDWLRASTLAEETLRLAERDGDLGSRAAAYWGASRVALSTGEHGLADEYAERAQALYAETDRDRNVAMATVNRAWVLLSQDGPDARGEARRVIAMLRPVEARLEEAGDGLPLAHCRLELARALLHDGQTDEADTLADLAFESFGDAGNRESQVAALTVQARARAQAGQTAAALRRLERAADILRRLPAVRPTAEQWVALAQTWQTLGETDAAMAAYGRAVNAAGVQSPPVGAWRAPDGVAKRPVESADATA